jgi:hypothetical protein
MKIKMLKTVAGPDGNWQAYCTYETPKDLPEEEAERFVKRKIAVWLEEHVEVQVADEPQAENTDARPKRKRGRPPKKVMSDG